MTYVVGGERCFPCRLIRVTMPRAGMLQLRLTWTPPAAALHVWAGGQRFSGAANEVTGDVSLSGGEALVYVGRLLPTGDQSARDYVAFTLATVIQ